MQRYEWLPALIHSIPKSVNSDRITPYAVALEGWRRGLHLKYYTLKVKGQIYIHFSLSNDGKEIKFARSTGPNISPEARKICKNKSLTKKYLEECNIPVPKAQLFKKPINQDEIIKFAESITYPVVLKPVDGKMGRGVIPGIIDSDNLKKALNYVINDLGYSEILVEKHIFGEEYRIYVVDGKVIGAIKRIPAYIYGDGETTIKKLIEKKNLDRKKVPSLRSRPIKINKEVIEYISQAGYTLESVLEKDELLVIRKNSNVSSGGEPIDVTDELSENIKRIAVDACNAIPDLPICGVDMIVEKNNDSGYVIELNTAPGIASHLFPLQGKARDIPKKIIDYYFPETTLQSNPVSKKFYFNYPKIEKLLQSYLVKEIILPNVPKGDICFRAYIIEGIVQGVNYRRWIKNHGVKLKLNGFAENRKDGSVLVVVAGMKYNLETFDKIIRYRAPKRAKITNIKEIDWDKPIMIGFEIKKEK